MAKLAGVSRSAVSRAFTPGASVSPKTRAKVQAAAEALGYQVNIIARTMNTGSSNFIGIITSGFDNPFRSKLLAPLIHQLALHGFMPLLMNADDPQQLAPSLKHLLSYHVAGVIITSGAPPLELAEEYLARKIPVTLINRHAELPGCDRVSSDNALGGKLAAELLHAGQCRDVGFIGENRDNFSTRQRYEGFIHHASGLAVTAHFCETGGYQPGFAAARRLAAERPGLQALFCATDMLAIGAMDGLRADNPAAVLPAIIGFDDIPQAEWQPYQLTTIQQDTTLLAYHAVEMLVSRIAKFNQPSRHREVAVKLIIRNSAK
ncbi:TPA: LacI family DNA-binding transcriptional regulator [Klebsiella aerogenes]|uniref:LacI family DNA-binding transcriptional regulator n=1 Tax=Klebsiella aerogenes TaxID=548 RepID=UPI0013D17EE9|nr:LacI family DNA-binding transcriptional regulator [Klebsiella aerogenes]EKW5209482.1 LacI family DNA-binding transcriptional regulator [Klebsiella aerogenes]ELS4537682.1 LacI family DNA-binding transcriptional regulator [Klebsiella aerogenes]EMB4313971.1 LacI family DNA-binding transcriptional regulator [Klebsiella aerogenes]EMB4650784.1 LacI family DNA-binding transcriptional regulator [Klebsiella aerogenes]HBV4838557.1 LacI family DNA-binding transcriptional regulator [Klebsiella aerogene